MRTGVKSGPIAVLQGWAGILTKLVVLAGGQCCVALYNADLSITQNNSEMKVGRTSGAGAGAGARACHR